MISAIVEHASFAATEQFARTDLDAARVPQEGAGQPRAGA
ncbi:Protein of unknown function [Propionibacterium freudenreichii]|nr:Protein of unknown function [Propionibacterium freudenreichii]CEG93271.1 Protein of unknown function [Propionibacterium freudenreichii]CEI47609.1 Protein of unknown function [Propionibacterium freudenreichii]CEI48629.1 Protein of unknown function [Propionibacterium freudenreichii]